MQRKEVNINDVRLLYVLIDNTDWEYSRVGLGLHSGELVIIDMENDSEIDNAPVVKDNISAENVLEIGVKHGVFEKIVDPENVENTTSFYYNLDSSHQSWVNFLEEICKP